MIFLLYYHYVRSLFDFIYHDKIAIKDVQAPFFHYDDDWSDWPSYKAFKTKLNSILSQEFWQQRAQENLQDRLKRSSTQKEAYEGLTCPWHLMLLSEDGIKIARNVVSL